MKWSPFPQNLKAADNPYVLATRLLQSSQSIADDAAPYERLRALRPVRNATTKTLVSAGQGTAQTQTRAQRRRSLLC